MRRVEAWCDAAVLLAGMKWEGRSDGALRPLRLGHFEESGYVGACVQAAEGCRGASHGVISTRLHHT